MNMLSNVLALMWLSVRDPREGLGAVLAMPLKRFDLGQALVLLAIVSTIVVYVSGALSGELKAMREAGLGDPVVLAISQVVFLILPALAIHWIARMFGGTASWDETLQMVLWLQAILLVFQVVLVVAGLLLPLHPNLVVLLASGLLFYLLSHFIAVAHGFASAMSVFLVTIAGLFALATVLGSFLMTFMGMAP